MQGLPLSESNYRRAVGLLKERFGQKQVLTLTWMLYLKFRLEQTM